MAVTLGKKHFTPAVHLAWVSISFQVASIIIMQLGHSKTEQKEEIEHSSEDPPKSGELNLSEQAILSIKRDMVLRFCFGNILKLVDTKQFAFRERNSFSPLTRMKNAREKRIRQSQAQGILTRVATHNRNQLMATMTETQTALHHGKIRNFVKNLKRIPQSQAPSERDNRHTKKLVDCKVLPETPISPDSNGNKSKSISESSNKAILLPVPPPGESLTPHRSAVLSDEPNASSSKYIENSYETRDLIQASLEVDVCKESTGKTNGKILVQNDKLFSQHISQDASDVSKIEKNSHQESSLDSVGETKQDKMPSQATMHSERNVKRSSSHSSINTQNRNKRLSTVHLASMIDQSANRNSLKLLFGHSRVLVSRHKIIVSKKTKTSINRLKRKSRSSADIHEKQEETENFDMDFLDCGLAAATQAFLQAKEELEKALSNDYYEAINIGATDTTESYRVLQDAESGVSQESEKHSTDSHPNLLIPQSKSAITPRSSLPIISVEREELKLGSKKPNKSSYDKRCMLSDKNTLLKLQSAVIAQELHNVDLTLTDLKQTLRNSQSRPTPTCWRCCLSVPEESRSTQDRNSARSYKLETPNESETLFDAQVETDSSYRDVFSGLNSTEIMKSKMMVEAGRPAIEATLSLVRNFDRWIRLAQIDSECRLEMMIESDSFRTDLGLKPLLNEALFSG